MHKRVVIMALIVAMLAAQVVSACTSILVSKGASKDGSVIITYSCDGAFSSSLRITPAADYPEGSFIEMRGGVKIKQVAHTYKVVGLMNEHQLSIGETTTTGREELQNRDGSLHYFTLMNLALQRAKTAKEAIQVIIGLCEEYGYSSTGETFSIADKNEAWIMEVIGKGTGVKGINYVAWRVPEGMMTVHANQSRIGQFPMDDPDNVLFNKDIVEFATAKGYYDAASGKPFSFREAFHPANPLILRYCATRVWSVLRRSAPSQTFSPDYHRGVQGAEAYPLFIKPDEKLSVADVFSLMRDHYEGTEFDMTKGIDAGMYCTPYRWRSETSVADASQAFEVDGEVYAWERPISTQRAGFVKVSQSRSWLPNGAGGVSWYTMDDPYTSPFVPFYCDIERIPQSYSFSNRREFNWDSAWWVYNFVSNIAYLQWNRMLPDIQAQQQEMENNFFAMQEAIDTTAAELYKKNPALARAYLTDYSVNAAEQTVAKWRKLGEFLVMKNNDGFQTQPDGRAKKVGYAEEWLRKVVKERPNQFKIPKWQEK